MYVVAIRCLIDEKVARETALQFNPNVNIKAYHESIYDAQFDVAWFKSFDLVMNALDNLGSFLSETRLEMEL